MRVADRGVRYAGGRDDGGDGSAATTGATVLTATLLELGFTSTSTSAALLPCVASSTAGGALSTVSGRHSRMGDDFGKTSPLAPVFTEMGDTSRRPGDRCDSTSSARDSAAALLGLALLHVAEPSVE
jgi:hypothetical protein